MSAGLLADLPKGNADTIWCRCMWVAALQPFQQTHLGAVKALFQLECKDVVMYVLCHPRKIHLFLHFL